MNMSLTFSVYSVNASIFHFIIFFIFVIYFNMTHAQISIVTNVTMAVVQEVNKLFSNVKTVGIIPLCKKSCIQNFTSVKAQK